MATVLFGWEIGGGFGHVQPLLQVARALAKQGHSPVFALRNVVEPWPLFANDPFPIVQAPFVHERPWRGERPFRASGYADVLAKRGWDRIEDLAPQVEAWQNLLDVVKPSLIVCDHSPTLCLAAYRTLPVVLLGSWFYLPPVHGPTFPLLIADQEPLVGQERMLAIVKDVQRARGRPIPESLPDVLRSCDCFLTVLSEVDPYHSSRKEPSWDPFDALPAPSPRGRLPFFAYLGGEDPHAEAILAQLGAAGRRGCVFLRSVSKEFKERLRQHGHDVMDQPPQLAPMLAQAAIIIHHGGVGTSQTALAAGRPQVLLPLHLEQSVTAQMLQKLGVGVIASGTTTENAVALVQRALTDRRFSDRAQAVAQVIQKRPRRDPLPAVLDRCNVHLRDTKSGASAGA